MSPAPVILNLLMESEEKGIFVWWCKMEIKHTYIRKEFRIKTLR
jgi:hypothetical protein